MFVLVIPSLCSAQALCLVGHEERVSLCILADSRICFRISLDVVAKNQRPLKAEFNLLMHQAGFSV